MKQARKDNTPHTEIRSVVLVRGVEYNINININTNIDIAINTNIQIQFTRNSPIASVSGQVRNAD